MTVRSNVGGGVVAVRKVDYDERQHLVYARARALSEATLASWMRVFAGYAPPARPGGRVLIRSAFADRMPDLPWYRYFPGARVVDEQVFPRLDRVVETFAAAGLGLVTVDRTRQQIAPDLSGFADRLRLRGSSTFEHLSEAEIEAGFAALDADLTRETTPRPVEEDSDVLVLAKN